MANQAVKQLLSATPMEAFLNERHDTVVTIAKTATVGDALEKLTEHKVLSLPVLDTKDGEFSGCISVSDILKGLIKGTYPELLDEAWTSTHHDQAIEELETVGRMLCKQKVDKLMHEGELWTPFYTNALEVVTEGFRIHDAQVHHRLSICNTSLSANVHGRDVVFNSPPERKSFDNPLTRGTKEWKVDCVVSQSDIVRLVQMNKGRLGDFMNTTIKDLGLVKGVETVPASTTTLSAFAIMHSHHRSSLGVTASEGGPLVGSLSVSDLRTLTPVTFNLLSLPVGDFLVVQHGLLDEDDALEGTRPEGAAEGDWARVLKDIPVTSVTPSTTLGELLDVLVRPDTHRVFIEEAEHKPVGIITLTDVLRVLTA